MKSKRLLSVAVLSGLALLLWANAAVAGVAFLSDEPLNVTWSELEAGKQIGVCNGTSRRLTRPTIRPTNFVFTLTKDGRQVAEPSGIVTARLRGTIAPGSCAPVRLRAVPGRSVDPGEYPGSLVLVAPGAGVTRLRTVITGPGQKPAQPTPVSAEDTLSLNDVTPVARSGSATLLLQGAAQGEAPISIGQECSDELLHKHCEHLGNLYQGSHVISVVVSGKPTEDQHRALQKLPITLKYAGHNPVGTYEGTLNLEVDGVAHPIKLKVDFKDAWYCAVIALVIGVGIVLLLQLGEGRWRLKRNLKDRRDRIAAQYKSAHAAGYPSVRTDAEDLDRYLAGIDEAIQRYAGSVVLLDTKSQAYVEIDKALKLAETDLRPLVDADGLGRSLRLLDQETREATKLLGEKQVTRVPQILSLAAEPLAAGTVKVGEAGKRAKRADELVPLVKRWRELSGRVLLHAIWLKSISGDPRTGQAELSADDAQLLATAGAELFGVRQTLFEEVTDAEDLARIGSSGRLESAVGRIVYLASKLNIPMPPPDAHPRDYAGELWEVGYPAIKGPPVTDQAVAERSASVDMKPAEPVALPPKKSSLLIFDAVVLAITVAISIIAGLSTFYFGKSFGTLGDYLTVIFTGTAVQVVSKAILEKLSVFAHDISPLTETQRPVMESVVTHT